jgi:peptidoglycan/xylan/chitin deacetylase (PgdA/CDA1 family)
MEEFMRILLLLSFLANMAFAHEACLEDIKQGSNREKVVYAAFYADALIKEFDQLLDYKMMTYSSESPMYSGTYAKILSARSYIEKFKGHEKVMQAAESSLLNIRNPKLYSKVINEIDTAALKIIKEQVKESSRIKNDSVIYPSVTKAGNVTGNTFPKKVWSLTFDDGPRSERTATIVDNLYKRNIRATFFMLTAEAKKYQSAAHNVVNSGMNVALHSYSHPNLNSASDATLAYQITQAKTDLEDLLNVDTTVFRLPYGAGMRNSKVRKLIAQNKYVHIFWNIDTLDWKDKDPKSILARVKKQMKLTPNDSGVILFHDIHAQTVIASELTMDHLLDNDYTVCTVEEVINHLNGKQEDCLK